jgi:cell fate regulator YaaT (PSP1 superfamily)
MSCSNCGSANGLAPKGCNNNGGCTTGSCNRLNTFDWLSSKTDLDDFSNYDFVEVSFKHGSHKEFYKMPSSQQLSSGEMVVVDTGSGYDVGRISLTGQLVALQMKKRRVSPDRIMNPVVRRANHRDLERLEEARTLEKKTLVRARAIARMLDLDMKIGDVEYQGDKRKATFYFTANGRVDFRELIRHYAKEFRVKIEMRQIGSRQESSRIGGIGSCGRELCCSTWLTTFKSVSTRAARYQNLAINQSKLSGQCGRLKCCLNYELDLYTEALDHFPMKAEVLKSARGQATLIKIDIFKRLMYYSLEDNKGRMTILTLTPSVAREIYQQNRKGIFPEEIIDSLKSTAVIEPVVDFEDVTGGVELKDAPKSKRRKSRKNRNRPAGPGNQPERKSGRNQKSRRNRKNKN